MSTELLFKPSKVFLSYHSKSGMRFAELLYKELTRRGIDTFDYSATPQPPGTAWFPSLQAKVKECTHVLALITKESIKSEIILMEWMLALTQERIVIPIKCDDSKIPRVLDSIQEVYFASKVGSESQLVDKLMDPRCPEKMLIPLPLLQIQNKFHEIGFKWLSEGYRSIPLAIIENQKGKDNSRYMLSIHALLDESRFKPGPNKAPIVHIDINEHKQWEESPLPVIAVCCPRGQNHVYWRQVGGFSPIEQLAFHPAYTIGNWSVKDLRSIALMPYLTPSPSLRVIRTQSVWSTTDVRVKEVKKYAWAFYNAWRQEGCISPVLGEVKLPLRAWRHLTQRRRSPNDIIRRLTLLNIAKDILSRPIPPVLFRRDIMTFPIRRWYRQSAIMIEDGRRIKVSVLTLQIGNDPVRFHSVWDTKKLHQ